MTIHRSEFRLVLAIKEEDLIQLAVLLVEIDFGDRVGRVLRTAFWKVVVTF